VTKILLCQMPGSKVEDLKAALDRKGYQVISWPGLGRLKCIPETADPNLHEIDLAIIDASDGSDGKPGCRVFTQAYPEIPLILLVAESTSVDRACKRLTGGNTLQFPFTPRKVINRVKKLLDSRHGQVLRAGEITLNPESRCVYRGTTFHHLTPRQTKLLETFIRHSGETLTRRFIMETVWDTDYMGDTRTLDVHVRWIRECIEQEPSSPKYLRTVRGIGYRFAPPSQDEAD
jgi:DNA-binding response OmpR family regulator